MTDNERTKEISVIEQEIIDWAKENYKKDHPELTDNDYNLMVSGVVDNYFNIKGTKWFIEEFVKSITPERLESFRECPHAWLYPASHFDEDHCSYPFK